MSDLGTAIRVLMKLDPHPARVRSPHLPTLIGTKFLVGRFISVCRELEADLIQVVNFQAEMLNRGARLGVYLVSLKHLDITAAGQLQIESEDSVVANEVERLFQTQSTTVETFCFRKIGCRQAYMCQTLYHDLSLHFTAESGPCRWNLRQRPGMLLPPPPCRTDGSLFGSDRVPARSSEEFRHSRQAESRWNHRGLLPSG